MNREGAKVAHLKQSTYIDPTHQYYAGDISLDDAVQLELAAAKNERKLSASPELNTILRVLVLIAFPIALLLEAVANSRGSNST